MKSCENGYIYPKARLVARVFEEDNQNLNKESPTCSKDSFRVINAIVTQKQWIFKLNTMDDSAKRGGSPSSELFTVILCDLNSAVS